jgi:hypothetical protein
MAVSSLSRWVVVIVNVFRIVLSCRVGGALAGYAAPPNSITTVLSPFGG